MATKKQKIHKLLLEVEDFFSKPIEERFLENSRDKQKVMDLMNEDIEKFIRELNQFKRNVILHFENSIDEIDYNNHDDEVYKMLEKINDLMYG